MDAPGSQARWPRQKRSGSTVAGRQGFRAMREVLRSNDAVVISFAQAILQEAGIANFRRRSVHERGRRLDRRVSAPTAGRYGGCDGGAARADARPAWRYWLDRRRGGRRLSDAAHTDGRPAAGRDRRRVSRRRAAASCSRRRAIVPGLDGVLLAAAVAAGDGDAGARCRRRRRRGRAGRGAPPRRRARHDGRARSRSRRAGAQEHRAQRSCRTRAR